MIQFEFNKTQNFTNLRHILVILGLMHGDKYCNEDFFWTKSLNIFNVHTKNKKRKALKYKTYLYFAMK